MSSPEKFHLTRLLNETGAYTPVADDGVTPVDFDRVWAAPSSLEEAVPLIVTHLRQVDKETPFAQIVVLSQIEPATGVLPFLSTLSTTLRKKSAVWKENSGLLRIDPDIIGQPSGNAIVFASTLYPDNIDGVVSSLCRKGYHPVAFVPIVDLEDGTDKVLQAVAEERNMSIAFRPLTSLTLLREETKLLYPA